jgi:hypothetical protein
MGTAARAAQGCTYHGSRHLTGDRAFLAGIHVPAIGIRRVERRDRDLSLSDGVPFAGAGSGARLSRHTTDPFAFHGCADILLPGRRLARICRARRATGGKPDAKDRADKTGCAGHGSCRDVPTAASPEKRPFAETCAPCCAHRSPGEAVSIHSQPRSRAGPGKKRMDGYPPAHGEACQGGSIPT